MPRLLLAAALLLAFLAGGPQAAPAADPEYSPPNSPGAEDYRDSYGARPQAAAPQATPPLVNVPSLLRRPIGLALSADERWLYVANTCGSISTIDLERGAVAAEWAIARQLTALVAVPGANHLLATDGGMHELLLLEARGLNVRTVGRVAVPPYPVSIAVPAGGKSCVVASLWSHRLAWVRLPTAADEELRVTATTDLPFAPREQVLVRDETRLIVADAFAGRLAIVDAAAHKTLAVRSFTAHNIRGLGVSPDGEMLIVAQQMLNDLAQTLTNDIHWGLVVSNDLRWLKLAATLDPPGPFVPLGHMHPLGQAGSATGDPAGLAVTKQGLVVVALGGVGEVALGGERDYNLQRLKVGRRPEAIVANAAGTRAYVANRLDDTISIVDLERRRTAGACALGPQPELAAVERGERLFYDATLSHDGWMSCHSCHTDGHANGQLNDNFSDGSFGAAKRVLSLLGIKGTAPFAWTGNRPSLPDQIRASVTATMQGKRALTDREAEDLAAFLESLPTPPPVDLLRGQRDAAAVARGEVLFREQQCVKCHAPPLFTTPATYDVGLHDKLGNKAFNPPSLRGLSQRGPYFHDGRAAELPDVFTEHGHQLRRRLSPAELADLLAFLRSL